MPRQDVDSDRVMGGDLAKNIVLKAGDIVIFPSRESALEKVNVLGEVRSPGPFPLRAGATLLETITMAGGPAPTAGRVITIVHGNSVPKADGKTAAPKPGDVVKLDLDKVMTRQEGADTKLRNGDTIILSKSTDVESRFFIIGQVKGPGGYMVSTGLTVLNAVAMAGGYTPYASTKHGVRLVKQKDNKVVESTVDLMYLVQPGDTIIIPEGWF